MVNQVETAISPAKRRLGLRKYSRFGGSLASVLTTLFLLVLLTFIIGRLMPIDPVIAVVGPDADQATYLKVKQELGLNLPVLQQFWIFLKNLLHGNFGTTLLTGRPVMEDIARVLPATVELATVTIILGAGIGIPLGVYAAVNRGRFADHAVRLIALLGHSTPIFWIGMVGLMLFYAKLGWVGGSGRLDLFYEDIVPNVTGFLLIDALLAGDMEVFWSAVTHIVLPASVLAYASIAYISRITRSFMLEQLSQEYVITARAKGVSRRGVIWLHAFKNIRVQLVTVVALSYGGMLEGAVLIETVFGWPGFGQYLTNALVIGDMNVVVACTLIIGCVFIALNVISDLLYKFFDPRIK
ncbi:ABC transporter permease [Phyllobacterium myrsinacearum]|uniref:Peptide/nickel transport system permease protein n=1 Tax=Phyllobacterium myrsinacearum TaxID=28101 RepID=A0A839EI61_9HYPH|nr:ABC transporter permease [Phyllobacterium myrsinacearum]MBA8879681.1 peptide/nickel transport system permease protein [Phyllobacterium myrsinacearum]